MYSSRYLLGSVKATGIGNQAAVMGVGVGWGSGGLELGVTCGAGVPADWNPALRVGLGFRRIGIRRHVGEGGVGAEWQPVGNPLSMKL